MGVFDFPILKFEEGRLATGVVSCYKGSVLETGGGVQPSSKPSIWPIFKIIVQRLLMTNK